MKTIADLKRALKPGLKLASTYHLKYVGMTNGKPEYTDEYKGIREVSIVQATQFALSTFYAKDAIYRDSWMPFPKKDQIRFNQDGGFTILEKNDSTGEYFPVITYSFQPETASQVEFNPAN